MDISKEDTFGGLVQNPHHHFGIPLSGLLVNLASWMAALIQLQKISLMVTFCLLVEKCSATCFTSSTGQTLTQESVRLEEPSDLDLAS